MIDYESYSNMFDDPGTPPPGDERSFVTTTYESMGRRHAYNAACEYLELVGEPNVFMSAEQYVIATKALQEKRKFEAEFPQERPTVPPGPTIADMCIRPGGSTPRRYTKDEIRTIISTAAATERVRITAARRRLHWLRVGFAGFCSLWCGAFGILYYYLFMLLFN